MLACPCILKPKGIIIKTFLVIYHKIERFYHHLLGPRFFASDKIVLIKMLLAWEMGSHGIVKINRSASHIAVLLRSISNWPH